MKSSFVSIGTAFALALLVTAATLWAADADDAARGYGPGYGYGPGPGMMGGYGGYGMGPGMMGGYGGYGPGYGMMGGYGGYGPGYGMMGGYGMGPGMMGYGALYGLDLSDAQRTRIDKLLDKERQQHWSVMGGIMEGYSKLRELYQADPLDPKKIGAAYGDIAKMQQQLVESQAQAQNEVRNVLTKEQREELRAWNRGGWAQSWGPRGPAARDRVGPGMMRR
jgi:Spy/CpxP family protein refolding chaperone